MNDFYTAEDVAGILKLKKYTVYEIIKRGELPCTRLGKQIRVAKEDLEQYCGARKKKNGSRQPAVTPDAAALITLAPDGARPANFVIAGQDYCLDILLSHMPPSVNGSVLRSYTGSYNSLFELYRGTISAAAVHLWDGETDTYNAPFVRRLLPGVECGILRLAGGTQGLYVKKNNPKGIRDWRDLARGDVIMINREKGCGTRILLDQKIALLGISGSEISGYTRESTSHLACAATVARGGADAACGCENAALNIRTVDFIPLQKEWHDLVYRKEDESLSHIQRIIEIAQSPAFRQDLEAAAGYDTSQTGLVLS